MYREEDEYVQRRRRVCTEKKSMYREGEKKKSMYSTSRQGGDATKLTKAKKSPHPCPKLTCLGEKGAGRQRTGHQTLPEGDQSLPTASSAARPFRPAGSSSPGAWFHRPDSARKESALLRLRPIESTPGVHRMLSAQFSQKTYLHLPEILRIAPCPSPFLGSQRCSSCPPSRSDPGDLADVCSLLLQNVFSTLDDVLIRLKR